MNFASVSKLGLGQDTYAGSMTSSYFRLMSEGGGVGEVIGI